MDHGVEIDRAQPIAIGRAGLWALIGLFGSQIGGLLVVRSLISVSYLQADANPAAVTAGLTFFSMVALVGIAGVYLLLHDLSISFIDLSLPSLRDVGYVVAGLFSIYVASFVLTVVARALGVGGTAHRLVRQAQETNNPEMLLPLIALSFLVVAPAEELFFRNIIQKRLYEYFDPRIAVVIASVLFGFIHIPAYFSNLSLSGVMSLARSVLTISILAFVLGECYRRTENLLVPIAIHGLLNGIAFAISYVAIREGIKIGSMLFV